MDKFRRRYYRSLRQVWQDLRWPMQHRPLVRQAMREELVSFPFRERLMMAVTAVNQCRYCNYYHVKESLTAGLPEEEIRQLQDGIVDDAPAEELPALLYAQHWAETDGHPDPDARQKLFEVYGSERAEAIETVLRMIRMGNLWGNTADYLLYKLSFGRRGLTQADQQPQLDTRTTQI